MKAPGARALVRINVDAGTGLVRPFVRHRSCGVSARLPRGLVAAERRHFELVSRHRRPGRRARVRLRKPGNPVSVGRPVR